MRQCNDESRPKFRPAAVSGCELLITRTWRATPGARVDGNEARRCIRPGFGAYRVGAPHHDGEVEIAVMEDGAVLLLRIRARMSQNDKATIVLHVCFSDGSCVRHEEIAGFLGQAVDFFKEDHH